MRANLSKIIQASVHATIATGLAGLSACSSVPPERPASPAAHVASARSIPASADHFASGQSSALQPYFKALYVEGEHNAVLNLDYLGLAALEIGDYATAEKSFDAAISRIEAIYADNPSARKAKSLFAEEKVKDFKGEPYERAMTYYYRGLLYARTGDYQNARASFLSAEAQSMMGESESYKSTFGLMDYLAGWASHCDGNDSKSMELGARAASVQPGPFSGLTPRTDFVGLADFGSAPTKVGAGQYRELLTFKTQSAPMPNRVDVSYVQLHSLVLGADLNWQATTRGGRPVDAILNGKANWKSNTEDASSALKTVGYAAVNQGASSNNLAMMQAGEIGMIVGLFADAFSHTMTPAADTRAWQTLPSGIALTSGDLQGGPAPLMKVTVDGLPVPASLNVKAGRCALSWGRVGPRVEDSWRLVANPQPAEARHENVNRQFRSFLESTFAPVRTASIAGGQVSGETR
jgi:tetratricopeptide (TPR) repeat protein